MACWGDHFDVKAAAESKDYCKERWQILTGNGLTAFSISSHLVGQAICDRIDERHKAILPPEIWGDGDSEGVRQRAAEQMKLTARACRNFIDTKPVQDLDFPAVVNAFSGSSIWHACYAFPPTSQEYLQKGYDDFGRRFLPILDVFEQYNVNFALEVHPTEIAFDIGSADKMKSDPFGGRCSSSAHRNVGRLPRFPAKIPKSCQDGDKRRMLAILIISPKGISGANLPTFPPNRVANIIPHQSWVQTGHSLCPI